VLTPQMIGLDQAAALPFASSLCGACGDVCPVKIKLPEMLVHLRHEVNKAQSTALPSAVERFGFKVWARAMSSSRLYDAAARVARVVQRFAIRRNASGARTLMVPRWSIARDFPPLAPSSFRKIAAKKHKAGK
jgi:L-lactate dehydrogenase complex protein LldF